MGNADLGTLCFNRKHTLSVSTYQAILLMLFNQNAKSTFLELQRATGIPEAECKRQLLSLTVSRNKATAGTAAPKRLTFQRIMGTWHSRGIVFFAQA